MRYSKGWGAVLIIILLLLLDQALKIWIKTHMQLHESIEKIINSVLLPVYLWFSRGRWVI